MTTTVRILIAAMVLGSVAQLVLLVRQRRLRAKYLLLWTAVSVVLITPVVAPNRLDDLVRNLGVSYPPTAYLVFAVAFLYLVSMHYSWELSRLEERSRDLAEEVALLLARVERLENADRPQAGKAPSGDSGTADHRRD